MQLKKRQNLSKLRHVYENINSIYIFVHSNKWRQTLRNALRIVTMLQKAGLYRMHNNDNIKFCVGQFNKLMAFTFSFSQALVMTYNTPNISMHEPTAQFSRPQIKTERPKQTLSVIRCRKNMHSTLWMIIPKSFPFSSVVTTSSSNRYGIQFLHLRIQNVRFYTCQC